MKKFALLLIFYVVGCSYSHQANQHQYVILKYMDFGPPALAGELLGNDYWQWDTHGDSRPKDYPISVVVYRNIDLQKIKKLYPVIKEKNQDYRYVEYQTAMEFLDSSIKELTSYRNEIPQQLIDTLINTRNTIKSKLCDSDI